MLQSSAHTTCKASDADQNLFNSLKSVFATMSEEELDAFEDDLNFCRFTGLPSPRLIELLNQVSNLDGAEQARLNEVA